MQAVANKYAFRGGSRFPVRAQAAGEALADIAEQSDGELRPRVVVEASRPEDHPLHPVFEWRDERAAQLYRDDQARHLIRSVRVVTPAEDVEQAPGLQIQYVAVSRPQDGDRVYVEASRAMSDADMRQQVLEEAVRLLRGIRARYGHLEELAEVFAVIERVDRVEEPAA